MTIRGVMTSAERALLAGGVELPDGKRGRVASIIGDPQGDGRDTWAVLVDGEPGRLVWADECRILPTFRFSQQCHLTYITDQDGAVVGIELMPWQETPTCDDYQEEGTPTDLMDQAAEKARAKCWELPGEFPSWVEWS